MIRVDRPLLARTMATITDRDEAWWDRSKPTNAASLFVSDSHVTIHPDDDWCATITHRSPAEAWEALFVRGVIGEEAFDARREFVCSSCAGGGGKRGDSVDVNTTFSNDRNSVSVGDRVSLDVSRGKVSRTTRGNEYASIGIVVDTTSETKCVVRNVSTVVFACKVCRGGGTTASPSSFPDVVSIASAWPSILAAEELVREACHRLVPWGKTPCETVEWRTGDFWKQSVGGWPSGMDGPDVVTAGLWPNRWADPSVGPTSDRENLWYASEERFLNNGDGLSWWRAHVETWDREDARSRGVDSPHAPVLSIFESGLGMDVISFGRVRLACPKVGPA